MTKVLYRPTEEEKCWWDERNALDYRKRSAPVWPYPGYPNEVADWHGRGPGWIYGPRS